MKWSELEPARHAASAPSCQEWVKLHRSDSESRRAGPIHLRGQGGTPGELERRRSPSGRFRVRREIALDSTAPTGDRLRAIEQIESRALGKPKETVTTEVDEPEVIREHSPFAPPK